MWYFFVRYCIYTALLFWLLHMPIVITGGRTSLFLSSQRMPSRYGCVYMLVQLCKGKNYIYVNLIIYVYIRTLRWLYVVITTKVFFGSILYIHSVVGNDTYSTYTKMGGRTSLFLTSQRMPSRYGCV